MPTEREEIDAVADAIMRTFCAKWFTGVLPKGRGVYLDCVNGRLAWDTEARAAIEALRAVGKPAKDKEP